MNSDSNPKSPPATAPPVPAAEATALRIDAGRFARLESITWWDQPRLARARVLVVGAGALGNEVIKNLALLGVGHLLVVDSDRVELSNLSRAALFRESDAGLPKAERAVAAAQDLYPGLQAKAVVGNVLADLGLGCFRWADVVMGAVDNREARVFINSACARVGRPWFDGGIDILHGVVRGFAPPTTACYECTMSAVDWSLLNQRRSCSLLARRALASGGTPTTPTIASIIAGIQVQELVKYLHGGNCLLGRGFIFDGAEHDSYRVHYPIQPDCPWHEPAAPLEPYPAFTSATPLRTIWQAAATQLGRVDALELARELVDRVDCPQCGLNRDVRQPVERLATSDLLCPSCLTEGLPHVVSSLTAGSPLLDRTVGEAGLPRWDVIWARRGSRWLGMEITGDRFLPSGPSNASAGTER